MLSFIQSATPAEYIEEFSFAVRRRNLRLAFVLEILNGGRRVCPRTAPPVEGGGNILRPLPPGEEILHGENLL